MNNTNDIIFDKNFSSVDEKTWLDSVQKALKEENYASLVIEDKSGLKHHPLYNKNNANLPPRPIFPKTKWDIGMRVTSGRTGHDNTAILTALQGGVNALSLDFHQDATPTVDYLNELLNNVDLNMITLTSNAAQHGFIALDTIFNFLKSTPDSLYHADYDPLSYATKIDTKEIETLIKLSQNFKNTTLMTASSVMAHHAGADKACEIGCILATALTYARSLEAAGLSVQDILPRLTLTLAIDSDVFGEIAKLRALRILWTQLTTKLGYPNTANIHAQTSERSYSTLETSANILRMTLSSFAAGIGGANIVTALPPSSVTTADTQHTFRLTYNTQLILQEESHIGDICDVAGGSWYIEQYTHDLCQAGWAFMQNIEKQGGMVNAQNFVADHIAQKHEQDMENLKSGKTHLNLSLGLK